ncbi:hypothetical protein [Mucilaginibacter sp. AK015]|uniref:hypothetical protein n=1 Tax=Mucilaginibacter sp. AK015 TaxID=2723072 RepID=UPI00160A9230|nr:hypothetical protein [Mucilaginibacter sp. AK015]MBB5397225.1 hypothetical protein [Mucilaginibacter sp. AK015]
MRIVKILLSVFVIQFMASCGSKTQPEPSLAGKWNITSAVGNDDRHWTGSFTLKQEGSGYTGLFLWDATDGQSTGTDDVTGSYNTETKVLTMHSKVITGNIEPVVYTMNVTDNGTKMHGTWTGSSDGSVEDPGIWSAEKE